jgi:putative transposase
MTTAERLQRVERDNPVVPIARQCAWLGVPRSRVYYQGKPPVSDDDFALMRRLDEIHTEHPFLGSRRLRDRLEREGVFANRKRIRRLMRLMGLEALYPKRKTSIPGKGHRIYPYRLRGLAITRPNQVWCADLTYIPMARGFCYLVAIMDWATRAVLSWRLSTTMEPDFCVEALEEALARHGTPEIFNTDQGAQFTSEAFTDVLKAHGIDISMDGKGRWRDNVFVERLWRSVKYEEVYLKAYESIPEARTSLAKYFHFYNHERRHQALDRRTPWEAYTTGFQDLAA